MTAARSLNKADPKINSGKFRDVGIPCVQEVSYGSQNYHHGLAWRWRVWSLRLALLRKRRPAQRKAIHLPNSNSQLPFSDGILTGNTLYLSGKIGIDAKTGQAPADVDEEIRILLRQREGDAGPRWMTMDDLVYVQVSCTDLSLFDKFNAIPHLFHDERFAGRSLSGSLRFCAAPILSCSRLRYGTRSNVSQCPALGRI